MLENIECDLCGSANKKFLFKQKDIIHNVTSEEFSLVRCNECDLCYLCPRPNESEMSKYYSKEYNFYKQSGIFSKIINLLIPILIRFKFIIHLINYIPIKKLKEICILRIKPKIKYPYEFNSKTFFLDIGCGSGDSIHFWKDYYSVNNLSSKFNNIYAIEPAMEAYNSIKLPLKRKKQLLESFNSIKFNHIRMNWSLEHVHYPSKYFNFVRDNINDDGKFLLCIPNYDGLIYKIDEKNIEVPIHLFHFKYEDINKYCEKAGLKIIDFKTFSYPGMYFYSSKINDKFQSFKNITPLEAFNFNKSIKLFDKMGLGNDMIFVIKKINYSG